MNIKTWQEVSKQFALDRRVMATNQMIWMQQEIDELRVANAAQAKRIAELEKDLVEFNEFKKIRDMQMQALRKQMS